MAVLVIRSPGTAGGPCKKSCNHQNCRVFRAAARKKCAYCHQPIGYGVRFYTLDGSSAAHALCFEQAAEDIRIKKAGKHVKSK